MKRFFYIILISLTPLVSFAQVTCKKNIDNISGLLNYAACFLNKAIIPILSLLAWVVFIFGVVTFIRSAGDEKSKEEGKKFILWGIVALFVLVSIWGIINILSVTLGTGGVTAPSLQPQ